MSWLSIVIVSYFILSVSNLIDKIFLSKIVPESIIYAIWVSILSIGLAALLSIDVVLTKIAGANASVLGDVTLMNPSHIGLAVIVGVLFTVALYLLYTSLQMGEASRIIPLIGGSMPVLIYSMTFWYDPLSTKTLIAFIFLVGGTVLISLSPKDPRNALTVRSVFLSIGASASFALFFVLNQYLFRQQGFLNGIVWPRLGSAIAVAALLCVPDIRKKMVASLVPLSKRMRTLWVANQALGSIGFIGQQYVISIPGVRVALVSALQSMQYVFILVFASLLTIFRPKILHERLTLNIVVQKLLSLVCIAIGLYFVTL